MAKKPTYEELEQKVKELENKVAKVKSTEEEFKRERNIFLGGPVVVFRWAARENWPADYVSPNVTQFGYQAEDFMNSRILYIDIIHPEDREKIVSEVQEYNESGVTFYEQEYRIIQADGEIKWVYDFTVIGRNDKNEITHYDGYILDNTERKQAEEALRGSEERYRLLLESISDSVYILDPEWRHVIVNEAAARFVQMPKETLVGGKLTELFPGVEKTEFFGVFQRVMETRKSDIVVNEYTFEDERRGWYEVNVYPIPEGILCISRDITSRKQAEKALRESENRFRRLVEYAADGFTLHDSDGKIIDVNRHICESLGYTREELLGLSIQDIAGESIPEKHFERWRQMVPGEPVIYEGIFKRKDGTTFPVEVHLGAFESGEQKLILGLARDITERKLAEEEQEKLQAQLQRSHKMEIVGTLAGGVAHDLNNILSGLVSYPELLLLEIPEDSPLRNPILTIQKSGQKAAAIVEDLLTLARRGVSVTEVVSLNLVISEYVKSPEHERLISFHPKVDVRTKLEADVLNIIGSPAHLSKTVMNLVSNAAEAMLEGGTISISTENRYIDKPIRGYDHVKEGDYVILAVSDTGAGIIPADMERIFEPFYTKKVMGRSGTGLGMAVVWGTVKDHKGYIDIQSTKGKGTTFTLYFPVTRKELGKDKALVSIDDYMGKGESILVIDDVEEQREIASKILKKLGYSFTTVSSGEEAVDYLKNNSADLLLLDMIMDPGIDGLETYKRIVEFHPGQKALIVSGFSETKRVKKAQKMGAGAYVKKPFLLEKIGIAVRDELDKK